MSLTPDKLAFAGEAFAKLMKAVERTEAIAKIRPDRPGNVVAITLLHAHALRIPIPGVLQPLLK